MFADEQIAQASGHPLPVSRDEIIRYMLGRPLDFSPGEQMSYSNFRYLLLGRVIENASGMTYENSLQREILNPLSIRRMRLGQSKLAVDGEVCYYENMSSNIKRITGNWRLENMDSHGGWIASATDLLRFVIAQTASELFIRPTGSLASDPVYYGLGWNVRDLGSPGKFNSWHVGSLDGTTAIMVRRWDGFAWVALFNMRESQGEKRFSDDLDAAIHQAVDSIKNFN